MFTTRVKGTQNSTAQNINSFVFTNPKHQRLDLYLTEKMDPIFKFVTTCRTQQESKNISSFLELSNPTRNYVGTTCRNIIVVHANDDHNREKMLKKVHD